MTFETLTVIELLLSVSNYPEDKCDKIRDELSTMDKKTKAFNEILDIDLAQHDEEYADNVMKVVNKYREDK